MKAHSFRITALALLLLQITNSNAQANDATLCKDHPAYNESTINSVLIRSWTSDNALPTVEQVAYLPRYIGHGYTPIEDSSSTKYLGLDLFHTANNMRAPNFRIYFQRSALVYMFVNVDSKNVNKSAVVTLNGWTSEGWAKRAIGGDTLVYGVYEKLTRKMSKYAYVFSRTTTNDVVDLPQTAFVKARIEGVSVTGSFNLWIAESDGSASTPVGKFKGEVVSANTQCPAELHDAWRVISSGELYRSWHPLWDPCFWCTYGHEHGSSPQGLMGYVPKYDLLQSKGAPTNEPDAGYKGYIFRRGDYLVYLNLHSLTSTPRRVLKRFYTMSIAVVDRKAGELLVDLQYRADLGFAAVKLNNGTFRPISSRDVAIRNHQKDTSEPTKLRSVNILDAENPISSYEIRQPLLAGVFEEWRTKLLCSNQRKLSNAFAVIFRDPATGIKSRRENMTPVALGRFLGGPDPSMFYQNPGLYRTLRFAELTLSSENCPNGASGVFYTDIGGNVVDGPSPTAVRQYFKANFTLTIDGRFETGDSWFGQYEQSGKGFLVNHGYGINPAKN